MTKTLLTIGALLVLLVAGTAVAESGVVQFLTMRGSERAERTGSEKLRRTARHNAVHLREALAREQNPTVPRVLDLMRQIAQEEIRPQARNRWTPRSA
ncbi:hypothetical protein [Actinocorallia herbida]|uniref:hypothetical protein n=1 Tax=Actinocorallia herbida TaxID=58109 RepID=UPI0011CE5B44|nr:hypothetical protein [Actinocorallia herbida]